MTARHGWLVVLGLLASCHVATDDPSRAAANTGLRYLGGEADAGFTRATLPRAFTFPADHGAHGDFRTEWWYFTGNLETDAHRHFGFELTFFRVAMIPPNERVSRPSAWATNQIWLAHFAVTDTEAQRFVAKERVARDALGLAGATVEPLRVWVEDWSASGGVSGTATTFELDARDGDLAVALELHSAEAPVAQGERGLDRKGATPGNASYYYSMPRLAARGALTVGGETHEVTGLAWLDREWSTSALEAGVVGWDWFALHLSDGSSLMFYRLRTPDGSASRFSGGSVVAADGEMLRLAADDVELTPLRRWRSAATGIEYPVAWALAVPRIGVTLAIEPYVDGQELDLSVRYWEGAVRGEGADDNGPIMAQGYLELAGY